MPHTLPLDLETNLTRPAPSRWTYFWATLMTLFTVLSFPGLHGWSLESWKPFIINGLIGTVLVAYVIEGRQCAARFEEYGLSLPGNALLGESVPVWLQLVGGPLGCRLGDLTWTLSCDEVVKVETDYNEYAGLITRSETENRYQASGDLKLEGELAHGVSGAWTFRVPLPAQAPVSWLSEHDEVGAISWRLSISMRSPGQPELCTSGRITVSA